MKGEEGNPWKKVNLYVFLWGNIWHFPYLRILYQIIVNCYLRKNKLSSSDATVLMTKDQPELSDFPDELVDGCLYPATLPYSGILPVVFRGRDPHRRPPEPLDGGRRTGVDNWLLLPPLAVKGGGTGVCAWLDPNKIKYYNSYQHNNIIHNNI